MERLNSARVLTALVILLPLLLVVYLAVGPSLISPLLLIINPDSESLVRDRVILESIRMPRAAMAALVGSTLAVCGAVMQGLFRNPLADPSLIGVSSGASAGASFVIVFGAAVLPGNELLGLSFVSIGAVSGAVLAVFLVYRLATDRYGTSVITMLLSGVAIGAVASALTNLFTYFADSVMLRRISVWEMGNLEGASWGRVVIMAVVAAVLLWRIPRYRLALNAFLLGESEARYLGIDVEWAKKELIIVTALAVGVSVVVVGNIAFVGLVVPHIVRGAIGPDHRTLIPAAALAGAILLLLADMFARTVIAPAELPAGVLTALVGAPVFFSLLIRSKALNNPERL